MITPDTKEIEYMEISNSTFADLEIFKCSEGKCLFDLLNHTTTVRGREKLKGWNGENLKFSITTGR